MNVKKRIITILTVIGLVFVVTLSVGAAGTFQKHYLKKQTEVGQLTNDWQFFYKDENGQLNQLKGFETNQDMEPIVYEGNLYLRAGFLLDYLGYGATLNKDEHKLTFYHPNFESEGLTKIEYKNPIKGDKSTPVENDSSEVAEPVATEEPSQELPNVLYDMIDDHIYLTEAYKYLTDTSSSKQDSLARFPLAMKHSEEEAAAIQPFADTYPEVKNYLTYHKQMRSSLLLIKQYNDPSDREKFQITSQMAELEILSLKNK